MTSESQHLTFYDGHKDPENCRFCGGKGWGIIGIDWERPDPGKPPFRGEVITCPCCLGRGKRVYCRYDCHTQDLKLSEILEEYKNSRRKGKSSPSRSRKASYRKGWKRLRRS
jgi:hypothetical protein